MLRILFTGAAALALAPSALMAQGALATQGYGYPTGQLSPGALATGGSTGEVDATSALNPAALASTTRFSVYLHFEPEYRRTTASGVTDNSTTIRFPGFMGTGSFRRFTGGISFTTLLDRTWENTYSDSVNVGGTMYPSDLRAAAIGAMTDSRFAGAYRLNDKVAIGVALHAISGENRLEFGRGFPDSSGIGEIGQTAVINFSGRAISAGAFMQPLTGLLVGASARFGGSLSAERDGVPLSDAKVPSRFGLGVSWLRIPNTTLAARFDKTTWSDLADLGTDSMSVFDATEIGLGIDVVGPRLGGAPSVVRFGVRNRTLPFGWDDNRVSERSLSAGIGLPIARGRGQIDFTVQRAVREAGGVNEQSWFLGLGLGIRP